MKVVVKHNQTIWDIAVQYTGDSGNAMAILQANGKNDTSLMIGEIMTIPEQIFSNKTNVFFQRRDVACAVHTKMSLFDFAHPDFYLFDFL